jgi:hypothetical protein
LGEITSANRQHCLHIIFECGLSCPSNRSFRPAAPWHYSSAGVLVPRIAHSGQQRLDIIRVRAFLSLESLIQASSALVLFECGRSCPSNRLLRASSASALFECRLRSLESFSLGQQRLHILRVRDSFPRIIFFEPAAPLYYLSAGFGPSDRSLRASSASTIFECGLQSLELFSSGQQRLCIIRIRVFILRISSRYQCFHLCPNSGGNIPIRMPYVKYEGKSTVCNTRWPGIRIKHALPRNFPCLRYEVCTDGRIGCLTMNWASTW